MRVATLMVATLTVTTCHLATGLSEFSTDTAPATGGTGGLGGLGGLGAGGSAGGNGGAGGAEPPPASCAEFSGVTGVQAIDPDGEGGNDPFDAYCEQDLAGGGWTLIGRSSPDADGMMGWRVDRGNAMGNNAYSLNVVAAKLTFTRVMLVARQSTPQVYTITVPNKFVPDFPTSTWEARSAVTLVSGDCSPNNGSPGMLRFMGHTMEDRGFFFRDNETNESAFGLRPPGFNLAYDECDRGGGLHNQQGEIFVR